MTPHDSATPASPTGRTRAIHAGFGVLATVVGMALAHLVAALTIPAASPVLAVGSTVIDLTPTPVKEWAVAQFGTADKPILIGSVIVVVLILAAVAGVLALRRPAVGAALLVLLAALAGVASLARPGAGVLDALPSLVAAVVGAALLWWLHRLDGRAHGGARSSGEGPKGPSRRGVLIATGGLAALAVAAGGAGRWITQLRLRSSVDLPAASTQRAPIPEGLESRIDGMSPFVTPNDDFYRVDTRLSLPIVDESSWTLTIDGDVDEEVTFTFDDLLAMDLVERDITLTCVSNEVGGPYVGGARWLGIPLRELLDRAGIDNTGANQILSTDVDGMTISTPLEVALDGRDSMLAVGMNGESLPIEHGFPARMVVPGLYGFISACKWINRITLTTYEEEEAYWTEREWAIEAPIKLSSRIDTPKAFDEVQGKTIIGGVAWAQPVGVGKVEVRIDGGEWQQAELGPDVGNDYWRQWFIEWDASKQGQAFLAVRATDLDGKVQTPARAMPFPEGSTGIQELTVTVA